MLSTGERICIWGGPATLVLFGLAMMPAAHFIPPLSPGLSEAEIVSLYRTNSLGIRIAGALMMGCVGTYSLWVAAISAAIKRMEGKVAPLAYAQLLTGFLALMPFMLTALLFVTAAYRPERSPEMTYMLNDFAWLSMVMPAPSGFIQPVITAIAILTDRHVPSVLPRWLGYLNIWVAILFLPGTLCGFFTTGPFAWNGLLAFWLPAVTLVVYQAATVYALLYKQQVPND